MLNPWIDGCLCKPLAIYRLYIWLNMYTVAGIRAATRALIGRGCIFIYSCFA